MGVRSSRRRTALGVLLLVPGLLGLTACRLPGDPQGALDTVTNLSNRVTASGWAFDESQPRASIQVHVYVDGAIKWASDANLYRPDVAEAIPGAGAAHGFSAVFEIGIVGVHDVCAYAINIGDGGTNTELGCKQVSITQIGPFGDLESIVRDGVEIRFSGWMIDPTSDQPVTVEAVVGFASVVRVLADRDRPDIAAAYPGYGSAHGFTGSVLVPMSQQTSPQTRFCLRSASPTAGIRDIWCRAATEIAVDSKLTQPTYLTGSLTSVTAIGFHQVSLTGSLVDSFDPSDTRGIYLHSLQLFTGAVAQTTPRPTNSDGRISDIITKVSPGLNRICLTGFESYTPLGNEIPRTIDCRDVAVF